MLFQTIDYKTVWTSPNLHFCLIGRQILVQHVCISQSYFTVKANWRLTEGEIKPELLVSYLTKKIFFNLFIIR